MKTSKDRVSKTAPKTKLDKLSRLKKRKFIIGDPEDIVHMNWLSEWTEPEKFEPVSRAARPKNNSNKG
ncbi:MAG TPA: hypothetical protein VMH05_03495 [Bryobacteraceae bacterium]|nr:hypothetical protein [Bryobacteraceae bacterium]